MNKKGFTLMELLIVIAIVAVVGVASAISFNSVNEDAAKEELINKYMEIQRSANLYLDLNNSELEWFMQNHYSDIKLTDLRQGNYITSDLTNPVTKEDISEKYYVRLCVNEDDDYVESCIIDKTVNNSGVPVVKYIANQYGKEGEGCCFGYGN